MNPFINNNTGGASNQIASLYIRKINESRMKYTREIRKKRHEKQNARAFKNTMKDKIVCTQHESLAKYTDSN